MTIQFNGASYIPYLNGNPYKLIVGSFNTKPVMAIIGDSMSTFYGTHVEDYTDAGEYAPHYYSYEDSTTLNNYNSNYQANSCIIDSDNTKTVGTTKTANVTISLKNGDTISPKIEMFGSALVPTREFTVEDIWWYKVAQTLDARVTNCSWTGTKFSVADGIQVNETSARTGCSDKRIKDCSKNGIPLYIFVWMGGNDVGSGSKNEDGSINAISLDTLKSYYDKMIYKLKLMYPNALIICMSVHVPDYDIQCYDGSSYTTDDFVNMLKEIAEKYDCKFVNLRTVKDLSKKNFTYCYIQSKGYYLWNGHVNSYIHSLIADEVINVLNN